MGRCARLVHRLVHPPFPVGHISDGAVCPPGSPACPPTIPGRAHFRWGGVPAWFTGLSTHPSPVLAERQGWLVPESPVCGKAVIRQPDTLFSAPDAWGRTELALIYGGTRTATVTCKDNVELLAVGRDDYIDIFMHKSRDGGDPEHLRFLKQITVFCGWPITALPLDDPSIFLYTYVRRGMVLCKDSRESEWIYVIKSGSCRVLTALRAVTPSLPGPHDRHHPVRVFH
ncbi:hypothetical protein ACOMHN_003743 [Nucella lapillus]